MTLSTLFRNLYPFVKPYRKLVIATLLLTAIGSLAAQVNAWILRYTVDNVNELIIAQKTLRDGTSLLIFISTVLISKELLYSAVQFGQKFFGEKLRIYISRDLSQSIVERILSYRMAFYTSPENESGKLQTRIDLGISSLTRLVQNFFIDMLPLFANAIVALVFMFNANMYVGLVGLGTLPIYFYVSQLQARKLSGFRRRMRTYRENRNNGIISLIESITVIKSFVREPLEAEKHRKLQFEMTENQMQTRRLSFLSHSISQIIDAENIIVMDNGHVVEEGVHEELYKEEGTYHRIFNAMAHSLNIEKIARTFE